MKTKETSTRDQAMSWKNTLDIDTQIDLCIKYNDVCKLHGRLMSNLTGREIEEIWRKENSFMGTGLTQSEFIGSCEKYFGGKSTQKQLPKELEGVVPRIVTIEEKIKTVKANAKEFKQFDESLFRAYIDKLPESESLSMIKIIYENKLPDCKFKAHLDKWFKL